MNWSQAEMMRLGGWVMGGHVPPFPPGEAPEVMHDAACKLCGENEYQRRRATTPPPGDVTPKGTP